MRQVLLRYFGYVAPEGRGTTLEAAIRAALAAPKGSDTVADSWKHREWIDEDYSPAKVMVANHLRPSRHNLFGDLLVTRPGQLDRLLDTSDTHVREAATRVMPPSNNALLVRSSMYWLVAGNHVVICSSGLQPASFEKYMTWLLRTYANFGKYVVDLDSTVPITDEDLQDIKEVSLGDILIVNPGPKTEKKAQRLKVDGDQVSGVGRVGVLRRVFRALYGSAEEADRLLDGVPVDQEIRWRFALTFRRPETGTSRQTLERAYRLMASQEEHGEELTLRTPNGRVNGESLVLQAPVEVREQSDGMIDRDDLLGRMQETLQQWIEDGRLE